MTDSKAHVFIESYINMKRKKTRDSATVSIVAYDEENYKKVIEIARRHDTSASAIISNFIDVFAKYFEEKPPGLDIYMDPEFVPTPHITEDFVAKILPWMKVQPTRVLESLDKSLFMAHVYARVLAGMTPEQRKTLTSDYPMVWRTWYK